MRLLYKAPLLLAVLWCVLVTPACSSSNRADLPPDPCPTGPPNACRVVIPPCQPPAYLGMGMPHDAMSQLGFLPYVATWLPEEVTWYSAGAYSSDPSLVHPLPWMHLDYAYWFPRPYNAYAPHSVIAFDETAQPHDLTANIYVPSQMLRITSKTPVDINGHAATLFEVQSSGASGSSAKNAVHVIGVEWQEGALWVRVTAVTSGHYFPESIGEGGEGEDVAAWEGTSTDVLLRVARSARAYTGCDKNTFGG